MALGNECDVCDLRTASITVENFCGMHGVEPACLSQGQRGEIDRALFLADEQVAHYVGWWPTPTALCEEIPVGIRYGSCVFTRAGASRGVTLRYGKINSIDRVEFLKGQGEQGASVAGECYEVSPGAICVVDKEYGAIQIDDRAMRRGTLWARCSLPLASIERVRIRYTAGRCPDQVHPMLFLLARYAATLLCSPFLCGVDLRCPPWDVYALSESETTERTETTQELKRHIDYEDNAVSVDEVVTDETNGTVTASQVVTRVRQERYPQNPQGFASPFGHLPAQVALWRHLRPLRRVRVLRA